MAGKLNEGQVALIRELIAAAIEEQFHAAPDLVMPSTARVLGSLVQYGKQLGYFTVGPGANWPGWVCDVCWLALGPGGALDGVALVVESEWGSERVPRRGARFGGARRGDRRARTHPAAPCQGQRRPA